MTASLVLTWIVVLALCWLGWQLLRQNGRLLLRLEAIEERLNEMEFGGPAAPEGLPVGLAAPEFDLPDLAGERRSLAQFRDQPLLLIFFNPDCGYCREMAPKLATVAAGFQPAVKGGILPPGIQALSPESLERSKDSVHSEAGSAGLEARLNGKQGCPTPRLLIFTTGDAEKNRQFFRDHNITSPILLQNDGEVAKAYQANGTPTGYLINAEGKIASELAVGGEALLKLADGLGSSRREEALTEKSENRNPKSEIVESLVASTATSPIGNRSLASSKIARDGLKAGTPAPSFRLPRLDGGELALEDLCGSRVLLVFSDPHCGLCDALAPQLERWHRDHPELRIVMISRGEPKENRAKVKEHGLTFPVVLQQQWEISRRYAMFATPIAYLIDEAGVIAHEVAVGADTVLKLLSEAKCQVVVANHLGPASQD